MQRDCAGSGQTATNPGGFGSSGHSSAEQGLPREGSLRLWSALRYSPGKGGVTPPTLPTGIPPRSTLRGGSSSGTAPPPRLGLSTWPLFWLAGNHLQAFLPPGDEEQAQRASAAPIQAPIPGPEQLFPPRMFYHTSSPIKSPPQLQAPQGSSIPKDFPCWTPTAFRCESRPPSSLLQIPLFPKKQLPPCLPGYVLPSSES